MALSVSAKLALVLAKVSNWITCCLLWWNGPRLLRHAACNSFYATDSLLRLPWALGIRVGHCISGKFSCFLSLLVGGTFFFLAGPFPAGQSGPPATAALEITAGGWKAGSALTWGQEGSSGSGLQRQAGIHPHKSVVSDVLPCLLLCPPGNRNCCFCLCLVGK